MSPPSASLASTAVVTPPAVSVKMPVVRASRRIPSRISSSVTASMPPPLRRARSSAYGPSAGLPIASDLAMVSGLTGRQKSWAADDAVGEPEAELLGGLERQRLGALGVVGAHVDVDERPLVLAGELGAQAVDV